MRTLRTNTVDLELLVVAGITKAYGNALCWLSSEAEDALSLARSRQPKNPSSTIEGSHFKSVSSGAYHTCGILRSSNYAGAK